MGPCFTDTVTNAMMTVAAPSAVATDDILPRMTLAKHIGVGLQLFCEAYCTSMKKIGIDNEIVTITTIFTVFLVFSGVQWKQLLLLCQIIFFT